MSDEFNIEALVKRYPLSDDVEDRELTLKGVAQFLGKTEPTVRDWVDTKGMPFLEAGTSGKAWRFQMSHVYAWFKNREAEYQASVRAEQDAVNAARLSLFPEDDAAVEALGMSPKQRMEEYEAQQKWMQTNDFRQQFCSRQAVVETFSEALTILRDQLQALPDVMERRAAATPKQIDLMIQVCDETMDAMHRAFQEAGLAPADEDVTL